MPPRRPSKARRVEDYLSHNREASIERNYLLGAVIDHGGRLTIDALRKQGILATDNNVAGLLAAVEQGYVELVLEEPEPSIQITDTGREKRVDLSRANL